MTTAEIVAYLVGVDLAGRRAPLTGFLLMPAGTLALALNDDERRARGALGADRWAYWVRRGYEEAGTDAHR